MIFTRTWLDEFIDLSGVSLDEIAAKLNSIGIEVDSATHKRAADKVVVGLVKEKSKVENADKLNLCLVDVGTETLQIVCGAKNVAVGQYVAVALVGAELPGGVKIKKANLRGVESCGMICSATELGFARINDGIMVLDDSIGELKLGAALNSYPLFDDDYIEVDLTPNRGDCLSVYGIARDLGVGFGKDLKELKAHKESKENPPVGRLLRIVADKNLNSAFDFRLIEYEKRDSKFNLTIQMHLASVGKLLENNILNLLNYATHSTGVLFNAYDLAHNESDSEEILHIKKGKNAESKVFHKEKLLSVAGIYQENLGKISDKSHFIIIEANYTDPAVIADAKDAYKKHDDEAIYRSFRGSEPQLNIGVEYLLRKMSAYPNIKIFTSYQKIDLARKIADIKLDMNDVCKCIGRDIDANEAVAILKRLGFELKGVDKQLFSLKVPNFRSDIKNFADVCEEILRFIGIDNIPSKPLEITEKTRLGAYYYAYKNLLNLRQKAVANGYFESVHYVLDNENELKKLGFKTPKIKLVNPINSELNALRPTLINQLLNAAAFNAKNAKKMIKIFSHGAAFNENGEESAKIAFIFSGLKDEPKIANKAKPEFVGFYDFLLDIKNIIGDFEMTRSHHAFLSPYEQADIVRENRVVGFVGRVHIVVENEHEIQKSYVCELDLKALKTELRTAKAYSKFPQISRDLSILVPKGFEYDKIKECINGVKTTLLRSFRVVDIYEDASLQDKFSLTIAFSFQSEEKTLEDAEINTLMDKIIAALDGNLGLKLR